MGRKVWQLKSRCLTSGDKVGIIAYKLGERFELKKPLAKQWAAKGNSWLKFKHLRDEWLLSGVLRSTICY